MRGIRWDVVGRISGVLFVVLFLGDVVLTPGEPDPGSGAGAVARYYTEHASAVRTVSLLHTIGGALFLVFLGALLARRVWGGHRAAVRGALCAGAAAGGLALVSYAAAGSAAFLAGHGGTAAVVNAVATLRFTTSSYADAALAVLLAASAAATVGRSGAARATGILAGVAAVLLLLGVLGTFASTGLLGLAGFAGSLLFAVWVLVVSLTGRERTDDGVPAVSPDPAHRVAHGAQPA